MILDARALASEGDEAELDPFRFWPDLRSRLVGLGGPNAGDDPDYAFHTLYIGCGNGPIVFDIAFHALTAERGTLILRVHELAEVAGALAKQVAISQTQLVELIRSNGEVRLAAEARSGHTYAVLGHIYGDCVANAEAVTVTVARRTPDADDPAVPTRFRSKKGRVRTAPMLVRDARASLGGAVSQLCTAEQFRERVFFDWAQHIGGRDAAPTIEQWEQIYIARVLDRYDVSRAGAHGLAFGDAGDPVVGVLIAAGCRLTLAVDQDPDGAAAPPGTSWRVLDRHAVDGVAGFDFIYATRAGGVGGRDRQVALRFIEELLRALKPGGLAVVLLPVDVRPRSPLEGDDGPLLRRVDLDRLAIMLISRGHQVAQVCHTGEVVALEDDVAGTLVSAFGLIIRRA